MPLLWRGWWQVVVKSHVSMQGSANPVNFPGISRTLEKTANRALSSQRYESCAPNCVWHHNGIARSLTENSALAQRRWPTKVSLRIMSDQPKILGLDIGAGNVKAYGVASNDPRQETWFQFRSDVVRAASITLARTTSRAQDNLLLIKAMGEEYLVGPDAYLYNTHRQTVGVHREFPTHPRYFALGLGALQRAGLSHIDALALGLPGQDADDIDLIETLRARFVGEHVISGRRISVHDVLIFSQAVAAVASFVYERDHLTTMRSHRSLLIDVGYHALRWVEVHGDRVVRRPLDSASGGSGDYLSELALRVRKQYPDYEPGPLHELDLATRGDGMIKRAGKVIDIRRHAEASLGALDSPILTMASTIGPLNGFGSIFVVGGAAPLFARAIKRTFPRLVLTLPDAPPIIAVARGLFVLANLKTGRSGGARN